MDPDKLGLVAYTFGWEGDETPDVLFLVIHVSVVVDMS